MSTQLTLDAALPRSGALLDVLTTCERVGLSDGENASDDSYLLNHVLVSYTGGYPKIDGL